MKGGTIKNQTTNKYVQQKCDWRTYIIYVQKIDPKNCSIKLQVCF